MIKYLKNHQLLQNTKGKKKCIKMTDVRAQRDELVLVFQCPDVKT